MRPYSYIQRAKQVSSDKTKPRRCHSKTIIEDVLALEILVEEILYSIKIASYGSKNGTICMYECERATHCC